MKLSINRLNEENSELRRLIAEAENLKIEIGRLLEQVESLTKEN